MTSDRESWDARYRAGGHAGETPDPFVLEALARIERESAAGRALDLACGAGRHAIELARRGWITQGWDVSEVGLGLCTRRARDAGVRVLTRQIDLAAPGPLPSAVPFDLVVVVDFLELAVLAKLPSLLRAGGWLIHATFAPDWAGERPSARFRIALEALIDALPGFSAVLQQHSGGRSGLLARRR